MDSLTHIALGAVIGEAIAGRAIGKKALWIGAFAQSLPDIDFVNSFFLDPSANLLAHRGITHSILFGVLVTFLLSFLANRTDRTRRISVIHWMFFIGSEIATHLLLDACNAYGVGWFEPFSHVRLSFHLLYVADPFFSVWAGAAFVALLIMKINSPKRKYWTMGCILITSLYFLYAVTNKLVINAKVKDTLAAQEIVYGRYFATPTPFNTWLWYIVAEADSGYYIGHRSVFDHSHTSFAFYPKQKKILDSIRYVPAVKELLIFSQGYYTIDAVDSVIVFNDLRFGKRMGWTNPKAPFVFRYYLTKPEENLLVMQRGRFAGWNKKSVLAMLRRIEGN